MKWLTIFRGTRLITERAFYFWWEARRVYRNGNSFNMAHMQMDSSVGMRDEIANKRWFGYFVT